MEYIISHQWQKNEHNCDDYDWSFEPVESRRCPTLAQALRSVDRDPVWLKDVTPAPWELRDGIVSSLHTSPDPALNRIWSIRAVDGLGRAVPIAQETFEAALIDWTITRPDDPRWAFLSVVHKQLKEHYDIVPNRDLHLIFDVQYEHREADRADFLHIYLRNGTWIAFFVYPLYNSATHIGCEPER